jgi:hypothetical protein
MIILGVIFVFVWILFTIPEKGRKVKVFDGWGWKLFFGLGIGFFISLVAGSVILPREVVVVQSTRIMDLRYENASIPNMFPLPPDPTIGYYTYTLVTEAGTKPGRIKYDGENVQTLNDGGDSPWFEELCEDTISKQLIGVNFGTQRCHYVIHTEAGWTTDSK